LITIFCVSEGDICENIPGFYVDFSKSWMVSREELRKPGYFFVEKTLKLNYINVIP